MTIRKAVTEMFKLCRSTALRHGVLLDINIVDKMKNLRGISTLLCREKPNVRRSLIVYIQSLVQSRFMRGLEIRLDNNFVARSNNTKLLNESTLQFDNGILITNFQIKYY